MILFILAVIGMSHVIVDGTIFEKLRSYLKNNSPFLCQLVECYQCTGWWCGLFLGFLYTFNPLALFAYACAGSFLSVLAANLLNLLESKSIVNLGD